MTNFITEKFWSSFPSWIPNWLVIALLINQIAFTIAYELVLRHIKKILEDNEELHSKYPGFRRYDKHWFTRRWAYYPLFWTFIPRFLIVVIALAMTGIGSVLLNIGLPKGKNVPITGIRYILMRIWFRIWGRVFMFGVVAAWWISHKRPKVCYKKYLGPNWKADYDGPCSTLVANHSAFQDSFVHLMFQQPSYVMKASAAKIPFIKQISTLGQCLPVGNDRKQVALDIMERQKLAEDGKVSEIIIHAEGGTTNGHMIEFKKGAF